jgi:glycosyltransferase involved in cell wall biosynthesis
LVAELDGADYYVHSASYEGFPISILDAAARGLPVIARSIDALTGSEAYQVKTAADVVDALERSELQYAFRVKLIERSVRILDAMNEDNQEKAWLDLYSKTATLAA